MADDWETAADEELIIRPKITNDVNKWQGEDDDEDVKESWEDEGEENDNRKSETQKIVPTKTKANKALKAKLTEQERLAAEEEAKRLENLSPEEKLAEKTRLQKIQQESDLKVALETFGVSNISNSLDTFEPETKEDFAAFGATIAWKISRLKESPHFPLFTEELVRSLCVNLSTADIKKVKMNIESLHTERVKMEKQTAKKSVSKGKNKVTLRNETDIDIYQKYGEDYGADYDDFM